ncbi:MAG: hypothetical protein J0L82_01850 [Deltaproteobacteria bacterium]|nr:hypothetical protein [Deltaproteobacteria bacterium]
MKDLGYSESSAYRRMMAARAIRAVPEAAEKIEDGRLNLVTLAKVQSVIRSEEKRTGERVSLETRSTMIAQAENKTLRETVRLVAENFPESVQLSGSQIASTQIIMTEEQLALLERVRELKSHSNFGASLGEIVAALAREYLDRNDPLRREVKPRSMEKESRDTPNGKTSVGVAAHSKIEPLGELSKGSPQSNTTVVFGARRASIAPSTRNFVRRRAGDACEYLGPRVIVADRGFKRRWIT